MARATPVPEQQGGFQVPGDGGYGMSQHPLRKGHASSQVASLPRVQLAELHEMPAGPGVLYRLKRTLGAKA
jgi:hypothetical protein